MQGTAASEEIATLKPRRGPKTVWNIKLHDGRRLAKVIGRERPTHENGRLHMGESVLGGPYADIKAAILAANLPLRRAAFLRSAIERGIFRASSGRRTPTLRQVSEWTGYSVRRLEMWLSPVTHASYRPMPYPAIRHILLEFHFRDQSTYDWEALLAKCK